ncbi:MAG: nuclear transport factor 2 family protein, partial [Acidimicrobiia bacterium]|nr:nuclear transport factor 2 family protein [Acidimicrobiia bacterium]
MTEDFVNEHTSSLGTGCIGRAAYRKRLPGFLATFEGLGYDVERTIAQGDRVAACYRLIATNQGLPVEIPGVMVFELRDGLVAHRTDYWDSLTFLRQTDQA